MHSERAGRRRAWSSCRTGTRALTTTSWRTHDEPGDVAAVDGVRPRGVARVVPREPRRVSQRPGRAPRPDLSRAALPEPHHARARPSAGPQDPAGVRARARGRDRHGPVRARPVHAIGVAGRALRAGGGSTPTNQAPYARARGVALWGRLARPASPRDPPGRQPG